MTASQFNVQINSLWRKHVVVEGDMRLPAKITSTDLRMTWVTAIHSGGDYDLKEAMAKHMSHQLRTAESQYDTNLATRHTLSSTSVIRDLLAIPPVTTQTPTVLPEEPDSTVEPDDEVVVGVLDMGTDLEDPQVDTSPPVVAAPKPSRSMSGRRPLPDNMKKDVDNATKVLRHGLVQLGATVTTEEVVDHIRNQGSKFSDLNVRISYDNPEAKLAKQQVLDRVCYKVRAARMKLGMQPKNWSTSTYTKPPPKFWRKKRNKHVRPPRP
jgi:hypothetical protein